jgi:hypothetical protein
MPDVMKWFTHETIYEGFPLYLRRPDHENVWSYQNNSTNLLCVTHKLEKVKQNGLPESDYNKSLSDFDYELVKLLEQGEKGVIVLIETFGGERNYWYYIQRDFDYEASINLIKSKFPSDVIETWSEEDNEWDFLKSYPFKLYNTA